MWTNLITVFNRLRDNNKANKEISDRAIAQGPSWRHRRRLIYGAYIIAILMIIFGAVTVFTTSQVGVEMVVGGVALLSIIVTAYTTSATYEDVKIWKRSGPEPLENPRDQFDTDNPDGI
jgi:cytochrome c-type biogenesis protein CcmH/NrfG